MTRKLENQLKRMFADLDEDLPVTDFTSEVMSELLEPRRRERVLWSSVIVAALAFLWLSLPQLEAGLRIVAGFPHTLFDVASDSLVALSQSPLACIYGTALGGYVLLWSMRRFQIRLMRAHRLHSRSRSGRRIADLVAGCVRGLEHRDRRAR